MEILDNKIKAILDGFHIAGATVGITDRERVVYCRGFGRRRIERADFVTGENTLYRAASITKVVTGILTMKLHERGILDIDSPVASLLDWFSLKDKDAQEKITLRHLLSHRSGLPGEYTPDGPHDEGMLVRSLKDGLPTLDLVGAPGEKYLYSNWGIRLLSAAIEAVTSERYSSLAKRLVLDPLGMTSSGFFLEPGVEYDLSMPHERDEDGNPVSQDTIKENYCRLATGGLYSTAPDLLAMARMIMRGGVADSGDRIISEASLVEMMKEASVLSGGDGYGLTLQIHRYGDDVAVGHYGSAPPYSSALYADLNSGYAAVVLLNTPKENLRRDLCELLLREAKDQRL